MLSVLDIAARSASPKASAKPAFTSPRSMSAAAMTSNRMREMTPAFGLDVRLNTARDRDNDGRACELAVFGGPRWGGGPLRGAASSI